MFYFQQMLQQGLDGIDRTAMLVTIIGVAYTILLIGFLVSIYQAALQGGDVRALAHGAIKYLVIALLLANWSSVFREVNDSFNQVAQFVDKSSGAGDMFLSWMDQLKQQFATNGAGAILPSITASFAAITTALMILIAYLIYAVMVVFFAFFYVLYGCVLYVLGPLVLSLLPMAGIGQLAKAYATNMMVWNCWGVLYAIFGSLITALQFNRIDQVASQGFFGGFFQGTSDTIILGLVSVFYAVALGLIPFIAKRLVAGDVGTTAYSLVRAGAVAVGAAVSGASGFSTGLGSQPGIATGTSAGAGPSAASVIGAAGSSGMPPPPPSLAQTIRGGVMSAVGAGAPPTPQGSAISGQTTGGQEEKDTTTDVHSDASAVRSSAPFRPIGITQNLAFQAGKVAGSLVRAADRSRSG